MRSQLLFKISVVFFAPVLIARGQAAIGTPQGLIDRILRQEPSVLIGGCFKLGELIELQNRTAKALIACGDSALDPLERLLNTLAKSEHGFEYQSTARWFLNSYATLRKENAYPVLRSMLENNKLAYLRQHVLQAIALAFDLTGYVDPLERPIKDRCRISEPRDALTDFIFALQTGNKQLFDETLGPQASQAIKQSKETIWPVRRMDTAGSVGFRFSGDQDWARPEGSLDGYRDKPNSEDNRTIEVKFASRTAANCGLEQIHFVIAHRMPLVYVIDNPEISKIVHTIATCSEMR